MDLLQKLQDIKDAVSGEMDRLKGENASLRMEAARQDTENARLRGEVQAGADLLAEAQKDAQDLVASNETFKEALDAWHKSVTEPEMVDVGDGQPMKEPAAAKPAKVGGES